MAGCCIRGAAVLNSLLTKPGGLRGFQRQRACRPLTFEQNENKIRTIDGQEEMMVDIVQDVVSLVSMSAFLMTMAMWIGAM